jgi:hypothetical protein
MSQMERRSLAIKELRIDEAEGEPPQLVGYASVFDSWSEELGGIEPFREKVVRGAFADTIRQDDIRCLFNHDSNFVLGRNKAGTLILEEDGKGLKVTIKPPDTRWAKDLLVSVKRGDISQMSFGFVCEKDSWSYDDSVDVRELHKVKLFDVSLVTYPAYPATECDVRSIVASRQAERDEARKQQEQEATQKQAELSAQKQQKLQEYLEVFNSDD